MQHQTIMKITKAMRKAVLSELGKKAGKAGGSARAAALTPERRSAIASKAAQTRWGTKKDGDGRK